MSLRRRQRARAIAARRPVVRARRAGGWAARRMGSALVAIMLTALILGGALAARLAMGPVSLGPLAQEAARRVSAEAPGYAVSIGDLVFDIGRDGLPPGVRALDLTLRGAGGEELLRAPVVSVRVDPVELLAGRVAPTFIGLSGLQLRVVREADGSIFGGQGAAAGEPGADAQDAPETAPATPAGAAAALDLLDAAGGPLSQLRRVRLRDTSIAFEDRREGRDLSVSGLDLTLRRDEGRIEARLSAEAPGADAPWLTAEASRARGADETRVSLRVRRADGPSIAAAAPELAALAAIEAPLSGAVQGVLDDAGAPRSLVVDLAAGAGRIAGAPGEAGRIEAASLRLSLAPEGDRLTLDRLRFAGGLGTLAASGAGEAIRDGAGRAVGARLALSIDSLRLTEAAGFAAPMQLGPGRIEGEFLHEARRFSLSDARIEAGPLAFIASGHAEEGPQGWSGAISAHAARDVPAVALAPSWPVDLAPGARDWVARNIRGGRIPRLEFDAAFDPAGLEGLLDFDLTEAVATPVDGLPPLEGAEGSGRVVIPRAGPVSFEVAITQGGATPEGGGRVDLAGSRFSIPDAEADVPVGVAELQAKGALTDILAVLDRPPLQLISKLGADLDIRAGRAEAQARLSLPLLKDVSIDAVEVVATASLTGLELIVPGLGRFARAETATLTADTAALTLEAQGALEGMPARATWNETFSPPAGQDPTRVEATLRIDPKGAARLGLPEGLPAGGHAQLRAKLGVSRAGATRVKAELDLTPADLRLPRLDWTKAAGAGASAAADLRIAGGIEGTLSAEGPGLRLAGEIEAAVDGTLRHARLLTLSVDGLAEGAAEYVAGAPATLRFDGPFLNLGALLGGGGGQEGEAEAAVPGSDLSLEARAGRMALTEKITLTGAEGRARLSPAGALDAWLSGRAGGAGGAPVEAHVLRPSAAAAIRVEAASTDAGAALRALGGVAAEDGGALRATATLPAEGPVEGEVRIENLRLSGEDPLVRALAAASLFGVVENAGGGGLGFSVVEAPFRLTPETLTIRDALARGASLGLTLEGSWARKRDQLDMHGVLTPAYAVNGLLNQVPVLGSLLGGEGEGIIGVTFTVTGSSDDPSVSVNPLSALAPGPLRKLFGGGAGEAAVEAPDPGGPVDK